MQKTIFSLGILALSMAAQAQIKLPASSPGATVSQKIGLTEVTVEYSRPAVKGRKVFGELVPYGELWRTGANASTKINFAHDVTIEGSVLPAGKYSFFTIPTEDAWKIIFNSNHDMSGTDGYDSKLDVLVLAKRPSKGEIFTESLSFSFENIKDNSATMVLAWDKIRLELSISQDVDSIIMNQIKEQLINSKTEAEAGTYYSAAMYYKNKGLDLSQALVWMNKACDKRPEAFWYTHRKAELLFAMGKNKEALDAAQASMDAARVNADGDYGYIKMNEDLMGRIRNAK